MVGVNPFDLSVEAQAEVSRIGIHPAQVCRGGSRGFHPASYLELDSLLEPSQVAELVQTIREQSWQAVGLDGFADKPVEQVGNYRLSTYNQALADGLWGKLKTFYDYDRITQPNTPTDHDNHGVWRAVGVSPLFRFIRYLEGGQLVAHYDATYAESDQRRTLQSLVIYLTDNQRGATRFLRDEQSGLPMDQMDFQDWDRAGNDDEVLFKVAPRAGSAIAFDHRLLHDGEPLAAGDPEKIIIRTDIMFEKI